MARLITEQPVLPLNVATFANQLLHVYLPSLKSDTKQLANKITEAALAFQQVGFLLVDAKVNMPNVVYLSCFRISSRTRTVSNLKLTSWIPQP
jgi:hypothetical protein